MSLRKFLVPHLVVLFILSSVWLAGVDYVYIQNDHQTNLTKFMQAQRRIVDNYVGQTDNSELYRNSIRGIVNGLNEPELDLNGTPLDTTFQDLEVAGWRDAFTRFEEAYLFVANNYPDKDMTVLTERAIRNMFTSLDPHSVYIEPEDNERIQEDFEGRFQGIGIQFNIIQDTITVITPISGGPSDQLGIMSGDRIIKINDSTAVGFSTDDVVNTLRGPKGTEVRVTIARPRTSNPLNFTIVRDDIPLTTLDSQYMLDDRTGYLKINRFAATTHSEFVTAANSLKEDGMERMVLDLRNNPGGYLSQAIAIAEEFFPRGTKLVSTESRHARFEQEVYSSKHGIFREMPVIVLVNEGSASASEIVSGAIQDHDRGLIVGRRTFGKGLVQQQYELIDKSSIRVTISRYLTPSGRLIQKPYERSGREEYAYEIYEREDAVNDAQHFIGDVPDSLKYFTGAGRQVYGGGGIIPDYIVQQDTTLSGYVFNFMLANRADFDFVREYLDQRGDQFRSEWESRYEAYRTDFHWSDRDRQRIIELMTERGMEISAEYEEPEIENDSLKVSPAHLDDVLWMVEGRVKAEVARQVWGEQYFYPIINDTFNDILTEAMELWDEVAQLEALAAGDR